VLRENAAPVSLYLSQIQHTDCPGLEPHSPQKWPHTVVLDACSLILISNKCTGGSVFT
jgi:hypothetical protein